MESVENIISNLRLLSNMDLLQVQSFITEHLENHVENYETRVVDAKASKNIQIQCPNCHSVNFKKNGHRTTLNGFNSQRFYCKDCHHTFNTQSSTVIKSTKLKFGKLKKLIFCLVDKMSLYEAADVCDVSVKTAFLWRHKMLDCLKQDENKIVLKGLVEADETYFPISYKGNHSNDGFTMPREPIKSVRTNEKRGISNDKICVFCAVEPKGNVVSRITNLGNPTIQDAHIAFDNRIETGTEIVTDKKSCYRKFAKQNELDLVQIKMKRRHNELTEEQPKFFCRYHIQHINSYHSGLKTFIAAYKGISSKYLDNYIAWNNFPRQLTDRSVRSKCNTVYEQIFSKTCYTVRRKMAKRPPIAFCHSLASQALGLANL